MKKKFYLLLFCLISVVTANAQWSLSPEIGISAYRRAILGQWRPGAKVGVALEYQLQSHFSLESGLYYTQRGYSFWAESIPEISGYENEYPYLVRHMFQMPLRARFSWQMADDIRLFLGAGPYLGVFFANNFKNTYTFKSNNYGRTVEVGLSTMAGVEVKRYFVRLGFDLSFGNEEYHATTISFGYKF